MGVSSTLDRWENMLKISRDAGSPRLFIDANIAVGDSVFLAWLYWDVKHPEMKATPADLLEMTRLVLEHERWLVERGMSDDGSPRQ